MTIGTHGDRLAAKQHLHWLAVVPAAVLGLMTMASPSDDGLTICPMALLTGVACPGCGMSRAIAWMFRGDLERSVGYHPLAPLVVVVGMMAAVWAIGRRLRGWTMPRGGVERRIGGFGSVVDGGVDCEAGERNSATGLGDVHG